MIPNPIRKVLSTLTTRQVQYLLMGGQACVLYGGAEFSRDTDIVLFAEAANVSRLSQALLDLRAEVIAVPPFDVQYLDRGLAIHFRCHCDNDAEMRLDVMSRLRDLSPFAELWQRRVSIAFPDGGTCELLSLPDLVQAKKTQRDKDWPMIRRLIESDYARHSEHATADQLAFWLKECRTPEILMELARAFPAESARMQVKRPLLSFAAAQELEPLETALLAEQEVERARDREYWRPLRAELEQLRLQRRKN